MHEPRGDLRRAKWLDPECYEQGMCQSLKFKEQHDAMKIEIARLRTALRFYARGEHYHLDDDEEFDTVSGEPQNWLHSGIEESSTMVESGEIARAALKGEDVNWLDGDEDNTPQPVDGEVSCTKTRREDGMPASADERFLRRILAHSTGLPHAYYDDGEAHGEEHGIAIDFMRDSVADISAKLKQLGVVRFIAATKPNAVGGAPVSPAEADPEQDASRLDAIERGRWEIAADENGLGFAVMQPRRYGNDRQLSDYLPLRAAIDQAIATRPGGAKTPAEPSTTER